MNPRPLAWVEQVEVEVKVKVEAKVEGTGRSQMSEARGEKLDVKGQEPRAKTADDARSAVAAGLP